MSFGNFLIKQVVEELGAEFPQLKRFSTLSPVPGFRRSLTQHREVVDEPGAGSLRDIASDGWCHDLAQIEVLRPVLMRLSARYLTRQPSIGIDPVAGFHLGNGARLERLNPFGDLSEAALRQSHGLMVNYLYDLDDIERNHETFANKNEVVASSSIRKLARAIPRESIPDAPMIGSAEV